MERMGAGRSTREGLFLDQRTGNGLKSRRRCGDGELNVKAMEQNSRHLDERGADRSRRKRGDRSK